MAPLATQIPNDTGKSLKELGHCNIYRLILYKIVMMLPCFIRVWFHVYNLKKRPKAEPVDTRMETISSCSVGLLGISLLSKCFFVLLVSLYIIKHVVTLFINEKINK